MLQKLKELQASEQAQETDDKEADKSKDDGELKKIKDKFFSKISLLQIFFIVSDQSLKQK